MLIVLDAITMTETGRAYVPISIPFGFHNRFYSKQELGLPEGYHYPHYRPTTMSSSSSIEPENLKSQPSRAEKPSSTTAETFASSTVTSADDLTMKTISNS